METSKEIWGNFVAFPNIQEVPGIENMDLKRYPGRIVSPYGDESLSLVPESIKEEILALARLHREQGVSTASDDRFLFIDDSNERFDKAALTQADEIKKQVQAFTRKRVIKLIPFMVTPQAEELAKKLGLPTETSAKITTLVNQKGPMLEILARAGVNIPQQIRFNTPEGAMKAYSELCRMGIEKVMVKIDEGASGEGMEIATDSDELERALQKNGIREPLEKGANFSLQELIEDALSCSFNFHINPPQEGGRKLLLGHNYQCLEKANAGDLVETVHTGNKGPLLPEHWNRMSKLNIGFNRVMKALYKMGFYGYAGGDFLLSLNNEGRWQYHMLEINGRQTGFSPSLIPRRLGFPAYGVSNVKVKPGVTLDEFTAWLERDRLSYSPGIEEAVIVTNSATRNDSHPKFQVAIGAQNTERVGEIIDHITKTPEESELRRSA